MPEVQTVLLTRHRDNWASGHHLPLTLSPEEAQRPRGSATPWGCPSSLSHPGADFKVFGQKQDVKYLSNLYTWERHTQIKTGLWTVPQVGGSQG